MKIHVTVPKNNQLAKMKAKLLFEYIQMQYDDNESKKILIEEVTRLLEKEKEQAKLTDER